jgi:hypothetical protein
VGFLTALTLVMDTHLRRMGWLIQGITPACPCIPECLARCRTPIPRPSPQGPHHRGMCRRAGTPSLCQVSSMTILHHFPLARNVPSLSPKFEVGFTDMRLHSGHRMSYPGCFTESACIHLSLGLRSACLVTCRCSNLLAWVSLSYAPERERLFR